MRLIRSLVCAVSLAVAGIALADASYVPIEQRLSAEQLHATGLDTLSAAQLALLNRLLQDSPPATQGAAAPQAPALSATQAVPAAPAVSATPAVAATQPAMAPEAGKPMLGFNDKPIVSRLKGTLTGWEEGTVFELENGQQWKVLKGHMKLPKPLVDPPVKLVPGIVGRWFLQVSEDYPMARVYLIN